jgi:hypothetical protein
VSRPGCTPRRSRTATPAWPTSGWPRRCGWPGESFGQLDIGLDLARRDELELVGTAGTLVLPDPWLCRGKAPRLTRDGRSEELATDPDGAYGLRHDDGDVYRLEFDAVGAAIATGAPLPYGKDDAVAQAGVLSALRHSFRTGRPVDLSGR